MENETNLQKQISFFVRYMLPIIIIPFITALIYVAGYVHYTSYLASFGIDSGMFPLDFPNTLMRGLYYLIPKTVYFVLALALFGAAIAIFVFTFDKCSKLCNFSASKKVAALLRRGLAPINSFLSVDKKYSKAYTGGYYMAFFSYLFFYLIMFFYIVLIFLSNKSALDLQKSEVNKWERIFSGKVDCSRKSSKNKECNYYIDFTAKDKGVWVQGDGFMITSNKDYLAIYTRKGWKTYSAEGGSIWQHNFVSTPDVDQ